MNAISLDIPTGSMTQLQPERNASVAVVSSLEG